MSLMLIAETQASPETSIRNSFLTGGRDNYIFSLNFSKHSHITFVEILLLTENPKTGMETVFFFKKICQNLF